MAKTYLTPQTEETEMVALSCLMGSPNGIFGGDDLGDTPEEGE